MKKGMIAIKKLVLIAVLGGSLNAAKFCLMYLPNIEVVTLLVAAYTYCFGVSVGFPAVLVFCTIEGLIFGFDISWLISYYIHWSFISLVACVCKLTKIKNPALLATIFCVCTALFGVQSTFITYVLGGGISAPDFATRFWYTYASGAAFYIAQILCNAVTFLFAFRPLTRLLGKLGEKYFGAAYFGNRNLKKEKSGV